MDDFRRHLQDALGPTYEIERELGGGGMSRVFVAVERALGRRVVIKVISPELAAGVNAERFRREIQLAAQLHHPHIVPLLSAGELGDLLYYTMPFIEGESLRSALRERGRLSVREVVRILEDVVDALAYAHARGIVHRDIKPDNILRHGSHALVTDFGVAKAISAALPLAGHTTTGMAIGTPAYMAPEQLAADPAADHRMDLYAIGLVAYELLTGGSPYAATSPAELLAAQLTRTPPPLHEAVPEVPPALSTLIMACLAKDPRHRPDSADTLLARLGAVITPQGGLAGGTSEPTRTVSTASAAASSASTKVPPPARARRRSAVAFAAGALAMVMIVAVLALRTGREEGERAVGRTSSSTSTPPPADSMPPRRSDTAIATIAPSSGSERTQPLVLTRAESLAIAEAVRRETNTGSRASQGSAPGDASERSLSGLAAIPAAGALADSIHRYLQRVYADSIRDAIEELRRLRTVDQRIDPRAFEMRGQGVRVPSASHQALPSLPPPPPGTVRIAILPTPEQRRGPLADAARLVADSLRARFARHEGWEVVEDTTLRRLPQVGNAVVVGFATRADVVLSSFVTGARDSVVVKVQVIDPRTRNVRVVQSEPARAAQIAERAAHIAAQAEALIAAEVRRGRRAPR